MGINNIINLQSPIPAFSANLSATANNVTGDGTKYTILCDNVNSDTTTSYNPATGIWTCPQTGYYIFIVGTEISGINVANVGVTIGFDYNATLYTVMGVNSYNISLTATGFVLSGSQAISLTIGDSISCFITVAGAFKGIDIVGGLNTYFCGYIIGEI